MGNKKMLGVYFSGTGNTKRCVQKFVNEMESGALCLSIENENVIKEIEKNDFIVLGYPIYFSNMPKIMHDFLVANSKIFLNKKVFFISTMGLFSGDGSGVGARLLKKSGAIVAGGLHLKMPDNITDVKLLKKPKEKNLKIINNAMSKIEKVTAKIKAGKRCREGLSFISHFAGLFGQRLWFSGKTKSYSKNIKIDSSLCVGCGKCEKICPMNNLKLENGKARPCDKCTMCYRCVNECKSKAITLIGKKVGVQHNIDDYMAEVKELK